jgi:hypothetical protein
VLIAGGKRQLGGTSCSMHTVDLCIKHALGLVNRTKKRIIVDSFPPGKLLKKRIHAFLSCVKNKKAKARVQAYFKICKEVLNCKALVLQLPNVTRVAGFYIMVLSALRSKYLLTLFVYNSKFTDILLPLNLSPDEWQQTAEYESVLRHMNVLAMEVQKDDPAAVAFTWLEISICRQQLVSRKSFRVFDLNRKWTPQTPVKDIPRTSLKREDLQQNTQQLLTRLEKEFERYFSEPDSDQLMSMILHPIMVAMGFR